MKADAIATNSKDVYLLMLFADCVPIMLYDHFHQSGWPCACRMEGDSQ